jgi:glycosyltransferase involved in cell wall biosynthesis
VKILIVSFTFPPEVGGVAEVARTQACGFAARGHEVTVATTFDPCRTPERWPPGVEVRQFRVTGSFEFGRGYAGELRAYQEFIGRQPADVMLFHCWQNWAVDVVFPALPRNAARKILLSHGLDAQIWKRHNRFPWGFGQWLRTLPYAARLPRFMKSFDRLVFLSARQDAGRFFDVWLAQRFCPERVAIIPNGVHLYEFSRPHGDFRRTYGVATKFLALTVANYDARKNQLATLRDFMAANRADATLVFIGGEFNAYQAGIAVAHAGLRRRFPWARVLFLEKVPKEMIYAAYQAADVFILSAKHETQPLALLDAMAAGVPFISTNAGCVSEFPGGLVARTGSKTTGAIQRLLNDDALGKKLGQQGRTACETKYDWERVLDSYEKLFADLTA